MVGLGLKVFSNQVTLGFYDFHQSPLKFQPNTQLTDLLWSELTEQKEILS